MGELFGDDHLATIPSPPLPKVSLVSVLFVTREAIPG